VSKAIPVKPRSKAALGLLTVGLIASACGSSVQAEPPAPAPDVFLSTFSTTQVQLSVGVIITAEAGQRGYSDYPLAAGALVAEYRIDHGITGPVKVVVADDGGTPAGSVSAVEQLAKDGVIGIVYASQGSHILSGVATAKADHIPVLDPYETSTRGFGGGAWLTGPDDSQVDTAMSSFVKSQSLPPPLVVTGPGAGGIAYAGRTAGTLGITAGETAASIAAAVDSKVASIKKSAHLQIAPPAVVVADAAVSAEVVAALEHLAVTTVLLGPEATTPIFADTLASLQSGTGPLSGATTQGVFYSVGSDSFDASPQPGNLGFLGALRLAAAEQSEPSLQGAGLCFEAGGAATADRRSEDAVVALADAAAAVAAKQAAAKSTKTTANSAPSLTAQEVLSELESGFKVGPAGGLAGPSLDFAGADALVSNASVVVQEATSQSDSSRDSYGQPCADGQSAPNVFQPPPLQWFAVSSPKQ
jgi:hypothetical protein